MESNHRRCRRPGFQDRSRTIPRYSPYALMRAVEYSQLVYALN